MHKQMVLLHRRSQRFCSTSDFTIHTSFFCTHSEAKYRKFCAFYFMYAGHTTSQRMAATFEKLSCIHSKANNIELDFLSCLVGPCCTDPKQYCCSCFISTSYLLVIIQMCPCMNKWERPFHFSWIQTVNRSGLASTVKPIIRSICCGLQIGILSLITDFKAYSFSTPASRGCNGNCCSWNERATMEKKLQQTHQEIRITRVVHQRTSIHSLRFCPKCPLEDVNLYALPQFFLRE